MSNPIRKVVGLAGPGPQYVPDNAGPTKLDASDYRLALVSGDAPTETTRTFVKASQSHVKMWVSWFGLQQDLGRYPTGWQESFDYMNKSDGPAVASPLSQARIQRLDRMIKVANDDGIPVILTVFQAYPTWASDGGTSPHGLGATQRVPRDCTASSPWGHFCNYLICRYKKGVPINPVGPNDPNYYGNPHGAWVSALEFVNEPNWTHWPQGDELMCRVQEMIKTAGAHADWHGWQYTGQYLLCPGLSDEKWDPGEGYDPTRQTDWESFTNTLASNMQGYSPQTYLGYSMHNYRDIRDLTPKTWGAGYDTRVARVQNLLNLKNWTGRTNNAVWLTEGGVNKGDVSGTLLDKQTFQDRRCRINVKRMRELPNIPIWTQHGVLDAPINNKIGVRNGTQNTDGTFNGTLKHPLWHSWIDDMPPV